MLKLLAAPDIVDGNQPQGRIAHALEAVRKHLGMEVAYVSEFVNGRSVFREVDAPGLEALIKVGDSRSLDDVYCRHILEGRLPELMADTADHPLALSMPVTKAVPIGAHMSVPVRRPDGQAYGMFCCLSPQPNKSLNTRDLQVMRVFADMVAHQIGQDLEIARISIEARLEIEQVIAGNQFTVVYQPIFDLQPFRISGFEALCRFTAEPYRSPDLWFKQADKAGCGVALEAAVITKSLQILRDLPNNLYLSINASPALLMSRRLDELLCDVPRERITLEITEHAEVRNYDALHAAVHSLRKDSVRIAVDDAGAGYSSFQHILQLKPDLIKLDIGLTKSVDHDLGRQALASALSYFAQETGCQIVAEGVETEAELATLKTLGVAKGQGYLLGRPMDLQAAQAFAVSPSAVGKGEAERVAC